MAKITLDQTDIDRIEEIRRQFDPAEHLATADVLEDLRFEEREFALQFMRETIRDELYGGLIQRAALETMVEHRGCSPDAAKARLDDDWNDRYDRALRNSPWGHNLMYMSYDIWNFVTNVEDGRKDELFKALWVLLDLVVVAMFGPIGNNYDEPVPEEV
jgi:hypothetical protein